MSDSVRPQWRQPTRLPRPWDSPGQNTGVGCHFLLQCRKVKVKVKSLSRIRLLATPWTAAHQAPPSTGFSRQEYWSGVPLVYSNLQFSIALILFQMANNPFPWLRKTVSFQSYCLLCAGSTQFSLTSICEFWKHKPGSFFGSDMVSADFHVTKRKQ